MPEKISRRIYIAELIVIVLPSSLILLYATLFQISLAIQYFPWSFWGYFANSIFALLACTAVASGLLISRTFVKQGSSELHNLNPKLWFVSFLGVVLPVAAWASKSLPLSPPYSEMEDFREVFELFTIGTPMIIPFIHLILESFAGKGEQYDK